MRTWPKRVGSLIALTIGLIACFAPSEEDAVDSAAARLPLDTPMLVALSQPDVLLAELADLFESEALTPEAWIQAGLDPTQPLTVARWPGESPFWVVSCAVANDAIAEEGADELLDTLTAAHRVVLDGARIHALVSLTQPDPEHWRAAARALEAPHDTDRLVHAPELERLGQDTLMVYLRAEEVVTRMDLPLASTWWAQGLDTCTLRASESEGDWRAALRCPTEEGSRLHRILRDINGALEPAGLDLEAGLQLAFSAEDVSDLWGEWADNDEGVDAAHSVWLDVAQRADLSPSTVWSEALSGQLTVSVNRWPGGHRRPGVMAKLGVEDDALVARVLEAAHGLLDAQPGVRLEPERIRGVEGWRIEWLRHRGHDLSWALSDGQLWLAYGSADLDDALSEVVEPQWDVQGGPGSAWVDLGHIMDLESVLETLTLDLSLDAEGLGLSGRLTRPDSVASQQTIAGLLGWAQEHVAARRQAHLRAQLAVVCDAVDLYAVDHGLPVSLTELSRHIDTVDPWGRPFDYVRPATRRRHHRYDLCSRGPDGLAETKDDICYE
jgi:hypothetical protein